MTKLLEGLPIESGYWWLVNPETGRRLLAFVEVGMGEAVVYHFYPKEKLAGFTHYHPTAIAAPEVEQVELDEAKLVESKSVISKLLEADGN